MKRLFIKTILVVLLCQMVGVQSAYAAGKTYYVASNGNNSNPGTISKPWKTIQKAANVATAGDTVYVRGGTYKEKVIVKNSGKSGTYITFSSYPGERAIINAQGIRFDTYHEGGFTISNRKYIQVIGFTIRNVGGTEVNGNVNGGFGVVCYQSEYCVVKNNRTYNTYRSGIVSRSSNHVTIQKNNIELANNDGDREMISVSGGSFIKVINNTVHNGGSGINGGEGININNGAHDVLVQGNHVYNVSRAGIYVDAYENYTYNITIDGNIVRHNRRSGISIEAEKNGGRLYNVFVTNNLVYHNARTGIILGDWGEGQLENIYFINNTVVMNGTDVSGGGIALWNNRVENVFVINNILSQNKSFTIEVDGTPISQTSISHNLLDGYRNARNEQRGINYIQSSARFVNAASFDFRLLSTSQAINKGTKTHAPKRDFTKKLRDGSIDIGAYESDVESGLDVVIFTDTFNNKFSGWNKVGDVEWAKQQPRIGARSIHLVGNASITRAISTQGYKNITLEVYLGAGHYENLEKLQLLWWNGSAWKPLITIKDGSTRENGKLNRFAVTLPAGASNLHSFKIRIRQINADMNDYGYIDSIRLQGESMP